MTLQAGSWIAAFQQPAALFETGRVRAETQSYPDRAVAADAVALGMAGGAGTQVAPGVGRVLAHPVPLRMHSQVRRPAGRRLGHTGLAVAVQAHRLGAVTPVAVLQPGAGGAGVGLLPVLRVNPQPAEHASMAVVAAAHGVTDPAARFAQPGSLAVILLPAGAVIVAAMSAGWDQLAPFQLQLEPSIGPGRVAGVAAALFPLRSVTLPAPLRAGIHPGGPAFALRKMAGDAALRYAPVKIVGELQ